MIEHMRRIISSIALLGCCTAYAQEAPPAGSVFLYPERVQVPGSLWIAVDRGMMFVPLNRGKPDSQVIGIEIYRFKADGEAKAPPIFYLIDW